MYIVLLVLVDGDGFEDFFDFFYLVVDFCGVDVYVVGIEYCVGVVVDD